MQIISHSPQETVNLGKRLSRFLKQGSIVCLYGELGAGKTTFVRGLALGLGIKKEAVNSPSFVLIKEFKGKFPLFHFDLYRLNNLQEIFSLGLEEYLFDKGISVIEWAERLSKLSLDSYLKIEFKLKGPQERLIKITQQGALYKDLFKAL